MRADTQGPHTLGPAKIIALDPGVRTFQTGFDQDGNILEFAPGDAGRLISLALKIDRLSSELDQVKVRHHARQRLKRKRLRAFRRLRCLRDEVHWQTAHYLCNNYDVILLPSFGVQSMVQRGGVRGVRRRTIGKDTTRKMLVWSHYLFRQRLLQKVKQWGKALIIVNESYTTKTCPGCGECRQVGGSKVFRCKPCDLRLERDGNGARNILLRAACLAHNEDRGEEKKAPF
jgi:putative transposase